MSYVRTLPRDLFNEGDLLKCVGKLWLALERERKAGFVEEDVSSFEIEQDPGDGSIFVANLTFIIRGRVHLLYRPLNARSAWPLYCDTNDGGEVRVFTEEGELSAEFLELVG